MARSRSFLLALCMALMACANAFAPPTAFLGKSTPLSENSTELNVKVKVLVGDGEPIESALRRFKREVNKSGHMMELRHKRYFENPQERKKRKIKEGRMRKKFERMQRRRMNQRV